MKKYYGPFFLFFILSFFSCLCLSSAQTGSVYITSKPPGANIWFDRNEIQKKTDILIENIPTGIHRVAVEQKGSEKIEKEVEIREDLTATVHFSFLPQGKGKEVPDEAEDAATYHSRGFTHFSKSQYDLALADFNKALELDPGSLVAYHNRGVVYFDLGQLPLAIADFTKAIELGFTGKGSYHLRGVAFGKEGQYDLALEDLNKALKIDPHDASIYTNRGILYLLKGQFKQTISDLNKAIDLGPKNSALHYFHLGFVLHKTGDPDSAQRNFSKAKEADPGIIEKCVELLEKAGNSETKRFYAEEILSADSYVEVQPSYLARAKEIAGNLAPRAASPSPPPLSPPGSGKEISSFTWILILLAAITVVLLLLLIVIKFSPRKNLKQG